MATCTKSRKINEIRPIDKTGQKEYDTLSPTWGRLCQGQCASGGEPISRNIA